MLIYHNTVTSNNINNKQEKRNYKKEGEVDQRSRKKELTTENKKYLQFLGFKTK